MFPTIIQHLCSQLSPQAPVATQHHWSVLFPDHSTCCLFLTSFLSFAYSCLISASYLSSSSSTFSLRTSSSILGPTKLTPLPRYVEFRVSISNLGSYSYLTVSQISRLFSQVDFIAIDGKDFLFYSLFHYICVP